MSYGDSIKRSYGDTLNTSINESLNMLNTSYGDLDRSYDLAKNRRLNDSLNRSYSDSRDRSYRHSLVGASQEKNYKGSLDSSFVQSSGNKRESGANYTDSWSASSPKDARDNNYNRDDSYSSTGPGQAKRRMYGDSQTSPQPTHKGAYSADNNRSAPSHRGTYTVRTIPSRTHSGIYTPSTPVFDARQTLQAKYSNRQTIRSPYTTDNRIPSYISNQASWTAPLPTQTGLYSPWIPDLSKPPPPLPCRSSLFRSNSTSPFETPHTNRYLFKGKFQVLSNFYPFRLQLFNRMFSSSEAAYQYCKAVYFKCHDIAEELVNAHSGLAAKAIAHKVPMNADDNAGWEDLRAEAMQVIIEAKMEQCAPFREFLMANQDKELVENTDNEYWARGTNGQGANMLGKIIMNVRDSTIQGTLTEKKRKERCTAFMQKIEKWPRGIENRRGSWPLRYIPVHRLSQRKYGEHRSRDYSRRLFHGWVKNKDRSRERSRSKERSRSPRGYKRHHSKERYQSRRPCSDRPKRIKFESASASENDSPVAKLKDKAGSSNGKEVKEQCDSIRTDASSPLTPTSGIDSTLVKLRDTEQKKENKIENELSANEDILDDQIDMRNDKYTPEKSSKEEKQGEYVMVPKVSSVVSKLREKHHLLEQQWKCISSLSDSESSSERSRRLPRSNAKHRSGESSLDSSNSSSEETSRSRSRTSHASPPRSKIRSAVSKCKLKRVTQLTTKKVSSKYSRKNVQSNTNASPERVSRKLLKSGKYKKSVKKVHRKSSASSLSSDVKDWENLCESSRKKSSKKNPVRRYSKGSREPSKNRTQTPSPLPKQITKSKVAKKKARKKSYSQGNSSDEKTLKQVLKKRLSSAGQQSKAVSHTVSPDKDFDEIMHDDTSPRSCVEESPEYMETEVSQAASKERKKKSAEGSRASADTADQICCNKTESSNQGSSPAYSSKEKKRDKSQGTSPERFQNMAKKKTSTEFSPSPDMVKKSLSYHSSKKNATERSPSKVPNKIIKTKGSEETTFPELSPVHSKQPKRKVSKERLSKEKGKKKAKKFSSPGPPVLEKRYKYREMESPEPEPCGSKHNETKATAQSQETCNDSLTYSQNIETAPYVECRTVTIKTAEIAQDYEEQLSSSKTEGTGVTKKETLKKSRWHRGSSVSTDESDTCSKKKKKSTSKKKCKSIDK